MIQREWKKKKIERKASPKESCARQITRPLGLAPSGNIRTGVYFHAHQLPFGAPILVSNGVLSLFIYITLSLFRSNAFSRCSSLHLVVLFISFTFHRMLSRRVLDPSYPSTVPVFILSLGCPFHFVHLLIAHPFPSRQVLRCRVGGDGHDAA